MGEGLRVPVPIFRFRNKSWSYICALLTGQGGFSVVRHVHLELSPGWAFRLLFLKILLIIIYFWYQLYSAKGYLAFANTQGISRLQLQHPVKDGCNPLTTNPEGCKSDFKALEELPYCSQFSDQLAADSVKLNRSHCEYFDEFDIKFDSGYQQSHLLIPTRRTLFTQKLDCTFDHVNPCPKVDKWERHQNTYMADIENFTVMIDHSMVNLALGMQAKAWDMIGFFNPCGTGKAIERPSMSRQAVEAARAFLTPGQEKVEEQDEEEEHNCEFMPIHRPSLSASEEEKAWRERGFAMWKSPWYHTILPFWPFEGDTHEIAHRFEAPFHKIKNGDIIKISDMLHLIGPQAALDNPEKNNRLDGMVIVIDIHYSNWKTHTWPNHVRPAYFYSFSLAPNDEYKVMLDNSRLVTTARHSNMRTLHDYHGIFIVIQQSGDVGVHSWDHIFLLFLGALIIESVYRSMCTMIALNSTSCLRIVSGEDIDKEEAVKEEEQLEDLITKEFRVGHGDKVETESDSARGSKLSSAREAALEPVASATTYSQMSLRKNPGVYQRPKTTIVAPSGASRVSVTPQGSLR